MLALRVDLVSPRGGYEHVNCSVCLCVCPSVIFARARTLDGSIVTIQYNTIQYNTIQYSFISAQHICSVHVMSNIVVDIYINAGLGDSY